MPDSQDQQGPRLDGLILVLLEPGGASAFHKALRAAYGGLYDAAEGDRLLVLASEKFREADGWYAWPDAELRQLLFEALDRVEWLQELLSGRIPAKTLATLAAAGEPHPNLSKRRRPKLVRERDIRPLARDPRLARALARGSEGLEDSTGQAVNGGISIAALTSLRLQLLGAVADVESRGTRSEQRIEAQRRAILEAWRPSDPITPIMRELCLSPFEQGRRGVAPPLVEMVGELARNWTRVLHRPPPSVIRTGNQSKPATRFLDLLRALERAHRREPFELGQTVVRYGVLAAKNTPEKA